MKIRKKTQNTRNFNITDAVTDGGTDLNKDTFNGMQDNIEEAINEKNYIVATTSSAQTISSNYVVNLDTIAINRGSKLTLGDGVIKIGSGVSKVRVSGSVFVENWSGGNNYLWGRIMKNTSGVSSMINSGNAGYISASCPNTIIEVKENDIIKLIADAGSGGSLRAHAEATWLCVEVIE